MSTSVHTYIQGVLFTVHGEQRKFHGTLALASADNLASQLLGGYKQLSSALRRCRYCMAHRDNMGEQVYKQRHNFNVYKHVIIRCYINMHESLNMQ